ncbi:uncharacterized protein VICG_00608 [Vittaforma corneae ATCC 50505]|uniref:Proteasome alpha-type subunits domain-containing protein n=1 Tax=Vittaforma corneae (strain ATCC 50505) TaxID=993615 RepID=L2GPG6_VITCO|nr:uncharacterized protein VICG_00608 [Vittaforma corneae ATCC 50505]ELA42509.1 hypothetical protein VICG_00608 [Vittaforma corneae ATCC 50505]
MADKQITGNTFTEEGRLSQAEFAIKNVNDAGTIIGLVCSNGVVLLGINLVKSSSIEKIYKVNDKAYVAVSGIFSDALRLLKFARVKSVSVKEVLGKYPRISVLCDLISQEKQYYTQMVSARPFGVSFLYSGYENDEYVLFSTDPSGTVNRWKACCFGMDSDTISSCLRNEISEINYNLEEGIEKILRIYGKTKEWSTDIAERLEILAFKERNSRMLHHEEIKEIISKIGKETSQ